MPAAANSRPSPSSHTASAAAGVSRRRARRPLGPVPPRPASGAADTRDALVEEHLGLVHHLARRIARRYGSSSHLDDLVSAGSMGLLRAVDDFDRSRGLAFSTYAVPRIHGAMLDELRRLDPAPRSARRKARLLAQAESAARRGGSEPPAARDIARHAGVDLPTLFRWQADAVRHAPLSLDEPVGDAGDAPRVRDIARAAEPAADERLIHAEDLARLREAILCLTAQERAVLTLTYFEELSRGAVAEVMGLSESRISRIRTAAIQRLREQMDPVRRSA